MTDDTLVNGLKAIFGTSQSATAIASSHLMPFMDGSGNPVGLTGMSNLASVLGGYSPCYSVNSDWYRKAKIGTIGKYQNKMLLIRYGQTTTSVQYSALITVNNRDSVTYFTTICKSGSPVIYYKNTSEGTELYLSNDTDYSIFEVYVFSNKDTHWSVKVEQTSVDFSTLTSVNL